jgi:hypothetical protein
MVIARAEAPAKVAEPATPIPAAPSSEVNAGAAIENAPPAAIGPLAVDAPGAQPSAAEPATPAAIETTVTKTTAEAAPTHVAAVAPTPAANANPAPADKAAPPASTEAKPHKAPTAKKTKVAGKSSKPTKAPDAPADRDASLIAALVAYSEGKPAKEINADAAGMIGPPAPATRPKTATDAPTPAQSGQFDPKRDVVLRTPTLSTAELVRRCRTLGFVEGMLCRNRVCANLWGKDPACPQGAAPAPTGRASE